MKQRRKIIAGCALICMMVVLSVPRFHAATQSSGAGIVTTQSTGLNVREEASSASKRLTVLPKGSYVTILEKRGDWWYVEYGKGKYGYCAAQYITKDMNGIAGFVNTQQTGLNVRKGPGTRYGVEAVLEKGTIFVLLAEENGWARILYNGVKVGYVSSTYVAPVVPSTQQPQTPTVTPQPQPGAQYAAVKLNVPSYKQIDSRWRNYPIGMQGGTIGTIGCTLTGISMMESYRTGTVITPNVQASKMSFTAGGALYWPSNYVKTSVSSQADCMQRAYQMLKSGKPVLIGGKTYVGSNHWVVITGYTGSTGSLSAWNFTINDPGSNKTTLGEYFGSCSWIHSLVYYK